MPYVMKRDLAIGILLQDQPVCLRRSTHSRHGLSPFVVDCPLRACVVDWRQKGGEYMTIKELDQRLTLVLEDFSSEMRSEYDDYSNEPVPAGTLLSYQDRPSTRWMNSGKRSLSTLNQTVNQQEAVSCRWRLLPCCPAQSNIGSEPDHPALDIFDSLDVLENFLGRFFGIRNSGDDNSSGHVVLLS